MKAPRASKGRARKPSRVEDFRLSDSPSHLLRRAQQFASDIYARAGMADTVTLRQTVLLAAIAEEEGRSQSELVRTTGVDRSTLADMMARMERKGLIARGAASDDGRAKAVKLTAAGRARLSAALPAIRKVDEALLAALPGPKRRMFRMTLGAIADAADTAAETELAEAKAEKKRLKAQRKADKARAKKKKKKR
jgi:DNA-binding MarR family transcriptional regulator